MLTYSLRTGGHEEAIMRMAAASGDPLPESIANAPELLPGLELHMMAFRELSTCRSMGQPIDQIPWTAIVRWADEYGVADEQREDLIYHVRALDVAFIREIEEQRERRYRAEMRRHKNG